MEKDIRIYLTKIEADLKRGIATEHTHRSSMEALLESYQDSIKASNDPKHIDCGAPDFIVERRKVPLGYVETKDVGVDLDKVEKTNQMKRYLPALNNLILTNYLEFRWYVNGEERLRVNAAEVGKNNRLVIHDENISQTAKLLQGFFEVEVPMLFTAKDLAKRMAHMAHFMRDLILKNLNKEIDDKGALHRQYKTFKDYLLPNLSISEFADLYAQTMAYGLFAARLSMPDGQTFNRAIAYQYLGTNKFLRRLFLDVGEELDGSIIASYLDDLAELLNRANLLKIRADIYNRTRNEDPIIHFYETFLAAYDPKLRESRGVYFTPEPVVQFIVNSVDYILREKFGKPLGLADSDVNILDPSTGTGTFLYFILRLVHERMREHGQLGQWQDYVHNKLLPRIYGFELLMAPYVMSHLKLGLLLKEELGYNWQKDDQLKVYLTNTLDEGVSRQEVVDELPHFITDEASSAALVKKEIPITVILGNPPYSGNSKNTGTWITKLVKDSYYPRDSIKENNPKLLLDDYVKFIRFSEWRLSNSGYGVLAFITNHGFINNATFREMRNKLNKNFNELYVLDLHGSSKRKELSKNGEDENVFDIQQGVSILIGILYPNQNTHKIYVADLWGTRNYKYRFLKDNNIDTVKWDEINIHPPFYILKNSSSNLNDEYNKGIRINEVIPTYSTGIKTHRDHFAYALDKNQIISRINEFRDLGVDDSLIKTKYRLVDTRDWNLSKKRSSLSKVDNWKTNIVPIQVKPFDYRYTYFSDDVIELPKKTIMNYFLKTKNIGLLTCRQVNGEFVHSFCSEILIDCCTLSGETKETTYVFPLYLYTSLSNTDYSLFDKVEIIQSNNFSKIVINKFRATLHLPFSEIGQGDLVSTFGPEDVFYYTYAVFHSPTYRSRYAEFLKIDFPRLPITSNLPLFRTLVRLGKELVDFHLLRTPRVDQIITGYPIAGDHLVEKVQYASGNVWINPKQYFEGVPEAVWNFKIGGYQVCDKWLKDRKGKKLTGEDINHYQRVVVALKETIRLMAEVDEVIPSWPME